MVLETRKRCKICGLTEAYQFAEFDTNGVCKYCRNFQKRTFRGADCLAADLALAPDEKVGVTVSGGKDSIYMWHSLSFSLIA